MTFPLSKSSAEKHLLFAFLGWIVVSVFSLWFLPPLDSHAQPRPLTFWSIVTITAVVAIYTAISVAAYFYQSWRRFPTVPNRISYGLWMGFESLVFLAILILIWFVFIHSR